MVLDSELHRYSSPGRSLLRPLYLALALLLLQCSGMNVATFFNRKMNSNPVTRYNDPGALFSPGIALYLARMPLQTANGALRATGKSCAYSVLMLAAWGDSSIEAAKRQAGVQQVAVITVENLAVLAGFLYHRHCTIVSGT